MNVLIVLCHPEPQSFNTALKDKAIETFEKNGITVEVSDLYAEQFDPVEKSEHYASRINSAVFEPFISAGINPPLYAAV